MDIKYILIIVAIVFLLMVVLGLAIVNYSSEEVAQQFKIASGYSVGMTPLEFAGHINNIFFANRIKILFKDGYLCDSFNGRGVLTLSSKYANKNELAGLAVCAHELGHAFQFANQPKMMLAHAKKLKFTKSIAWLVSPLIIAGIIMLLFSYYILAIVLGTLGLFAFLTLIITKWTTVKVEKGASIKALKLLDVYAGLSEEQLAVAKKFLNSAKQTYLAELLRIMLKWTFLVKKR